MAVSAQKQLNGSQAKDENHIAITPANFFKTTDITGTPITSPATVSSSVVTVTVPLDAVEMVIWSTTNLVRVSELSDCSLYATPPSSVPVTFPVAKQKNVYLLRDGASDATVYFFFRTLTHT